MSEPSIDKEELAAAFARCFRGEDGRQVIEHLRGMTLEQACGPQIGEAHLRHLEGQRFLVSYVESMVRRGRGESSR